MSERPPFRAVQASVDFPALERDILDLWDDIRAFETSVEMRPLSSEYTFYDGPPFPTGSPHYGNLLAGILKDIVPRYWTMRGHRVERRFGWDTHGLPVEMDVQKQLGLSSPAEIEAAGIDVFNEACRTLVTANTEMWETITRRIGRWVDFENDYKTMDTDFMESVWWVFRALWHKDLVYRDFKVLPYSYGATTPLSNFEANMDYRDVDDPSIIVRLEIAADSGPVSAGDYLLIWTTTPWTLPSNLAVAVGRKLRYVRIDAPLDGHEGRYWIAAERVAAHWGPDAPVPALEASGADLIGTAYHPPFEYFGEERDRGAFVVIESDDVTIEEGTGLVHMAPAYGEADFYALQAAGLDVLVDPVDAVGTFTTAVPDVAGMVVKDADDTLIGLLRASGALVRSERIVHSYPFCWRTDTPLIYKAIPTWFVRVESFRDRMAELNEKVHWVPEHIGSRRFGNWLAQARDWAISRNRYWGSCIPVWECDGCDELACIGSIDELAERSGVRLDDLHKHNVDPVTFPCSSCDGTMLRVPEVLDCWFESGSMPYALDHYPFGGTADFERRFPADYIAEGLDQTRGWFYTLVVLGTALFDQIPFRNCVVNGLILAEDGRKMSKSLKNYPDPLELIEATGADALRAYLINSPVVRAEPVRFSEHGVRGVVRTVMLPYWNAYSFFTTYAAAESLTIEDLAAAPSIPQRPEIDRWILSVLQSLVRRVNEEMEGYYLFNVIPALVEFIGDLTNWYIRRSRRRFWRQRSKGGTKGDADLLAAFATLYEVLETFSKLMAPVLPFVTEVIYQGLVVEPRSGTPGPASIHHEDYPEAVGKLIDRPLETDMAIVRSIVSLGRVLRVQEQIRVRQPLTMLTVITHESAVRRAVDSHADLIAEELNVKSVATSEDESAYAHVTVKPDFGILGPRLGPRTRQVAAGIPQLDDATISTLLDGGTVIVADEPLTVSDLVVARTPRDGFVVASDDRVSVALDTKVTETLVAEGLSREIVKLVQGLRRAAGLDVSDRITLQWWSTSERLATAMADHGASVAQAVLATELSRVDTPPGPVIDAAGEKISLAITPA